MVFNENFTHFIPDSRAGVYCEFFEIFKNIYMAEELWTAANKVRNIQKATNPVPQNKYPKKYVRRNKVLRKIFW